MRDFIEYMDSESLRTLKAAVEARAVFPTAARAPVPADGQLILTAEINPWAQTLADRRRHEYIDLVDVELTLPPLREPAWGHPRGVFARMWQ